MKPVLFTEREPVENQSIIVWDDKVKRWCGIFCYAGVVPRYCTMLGVTHWLPMPPAPVLFEPVEGEELTDIGLSYREVDAAIKELRATDEC